ncbi:MAG: 4Fe-4S binding protein [Desulfovibrionaceae bacterium]|nr:4Fe-4S binding protein [Desulfovibrionaceae bacterium]MBR5734094.1 4Fe-4S binding protein [Desulfovibrionaceae bacterium]
MLVSINRQWCKGCGVCVEFCPKKALHLDEDEKAVWTPENCSKCGLCEHYCPDLAIQAIKDANPEEA